MQSFTGNPSAVGHSLPTLQRAPKVNEGPWFRNLGLAYVKKNLLHFPLQNDNTPTGKWKRNAGFLKNIFPKYRSNTMFSYLYFTLTSFSLYCLLLIVNVYYWCVLQN